MTRILGIETSCDETSAAVLDGAGDDVVLRSLVILSQDVHKVFGGVVPEIASRAHLTTLPAVVRRALEEAGAAPSSVDAIAVTYAPGLVGALLVGVSYGKALAFGLGKPVVAVHHMEGHLFATALEHRDAVPPFTALLVSGGHTMLLDVEAWGRYRLLGETRDDAAGEAFDKVAKVLGLPYPGGPHIERVAKEGDPARFRFARPMLRRNQQAGDDDYYDVSFSGLKTAVRNAVVGAHAGGVPSGRSLSQQPPGAASSFTLPPDVVASIARGFQDALIETLVEKTARAAEQFGRARIVLGGGVACNRTLAEAMRVRASSLGAAVYAPSPRLATDNAAMIARAGLYRFERGDLAGLELSAYASRPLPGLVEPAAAGGRRTATSSPR